MSSTNGDFGTAVAIRRDVILVGAPFEDPVVEDGTGYTDAAGAVYVFQREHHGSWFRTQRVRPNQQSEEVDAFNGFGPTLAMDDERVAIGAPFTTDPLQDVLGQTDVYQWQGATLVLEQEVHAASPSPGFALSMWRHRLIIGVNTFVHGPINYAWIVDYGANAQ